jgi:hypothetical protein
VSSMCDNRTTGIFMHMLGVAKFFGFKEVRTY